ncbi:histidine kinase [Actinomadura fulvescens]|uniref:histidine kinase n=1 Tax=Actinomadura fulvescens TaxID=46160 RepID=A0ABN3PRC6_9ACTN
MGDVLRQERSLESVTRFTQAAAPWVLCAVMFAVTLLIYSVGRHDPVRDGAMVLCAVVAAAACGLARWRLWPLFWVTGVGVLLFSSWPTAIVASYYVGTRLRHGFHMVLYASAAVMGLLAVPAVYEVFGLRFPLGSDVRLSLTERAISLLPLIAFPLTVGLGINARRQVLAGVRERADRLEREHEARAEQARAAERSRIAREMHDVVAHKVSLMVMQAGALEVEARDTEAARTAALIGDTGRGALTDLRAVLGVLRSAAVNDRLAPPPLLSDLDRLLEQSRSVGMIVDRHDQGVVRPLGAAAERAAYRIVQEALTNAHRHAQGAATSVVLSYRPDGLEVTVRNTTPATGPVVPSWPGGGLGLLGLRERLELIGGRFDFGPRPDGGFGVRAFIPDTSAGDVT